MSLSYSEMIFSLKEKEISVIKDAASRLDKIIEERGAHAEFAKKVLKFWTAEDVSPQKDCIYWLFLNSRAFTDLDSLVNFIGHELLDDGGYVIKWTRYNESMRQVETFPFDPDGWPEVFISSSDNNSSDPNRLIELMDWFVNISEKKRVEREDREQRVKELFRKVRQPDNS